MATSEPSKEAVETPLLNEREDRLVRSILDFIGQFLKESDRAAVILVGARLDYLLGEMLSRFLLPSTGSVDELLDTDRSLGTFSARIHATYRLGLIDSEFARSLHIFRRLRNTFAHEISGSSLDHGASKDRIRELIAPVAHYDGFSKLRARYFKDKPQVAADFFTVSAMLVIRLEEACEDVQRVGASTTMQLVPSNWTVAASEKS